ncbi:TonB-dependent receptor [Paraflavitalea sp. CAU 1676]|uniref:SusC/RagA family TonB-linked outer membrane protein n=1 Tax=Paraflavitalea sp. CAU 1676 TaxID=3032598 RepID=UPI0023DB0CE4|nr:TonB-dependent receptor [Paraflavitalea sp. CAU 1676]MDF2190346.1 TonB-dependent receptor [Paraflavitalea sp. CAU 1676]
MTRNLNRLLTCLCLLGSLLFSHYGQAQQAAAARGIVRDEKNEPVAGATVTVENKSASFSATSQTDGEGAFSFTDLATGGTYTFVVSHLGFEKQELKGYRYEGKPIILSVQLLSTSSQLTDVVVVGYGTQKKANLTGAVGQVDAKAIRDRPVANASQALQGKVPGLNITFGDGHPGSGGTFNVRGFATVTGGTGAPLVLVDGVPGNINMINPRDIENISVLKDASAAAIYGARAAFGVILVTTKTAKKGKIIVNYSNNFSWQTPTVRTDFMTDGYDVAKMMDSAFLRSTGNTYTRYTDKDYEELKKRQTDKSLPSVVVDNRNGKDMYIYYGNTDWWSTMFRDYSPSMQHTLSVSGSSEKVDYYLSGRFQQQKGMMQVNQDQYNAYNFRAKINARVTPWMTLYTNTQLSIDKYSYPGWGYNSNFVSITVHALPSYVPVNPDGTATYRTELNNYTIGDGIYADLLYGKSKGENRNYNATNTVGATFKVAKGLELNANYTYELNPVTPGVNTHEISRRTKAPWSIYPGVTSYVGNDRFYEILRLDQYHVVNAFGTYEKKISKHGFKVMAGYNQEFRTYKTLRGERSDLLSEDLNELDLGTGTNLATGNSNEWALLGFFGRLNYDFDGKYLLELNGRYDGTSRFPKGKRFGFFPSVSAGWRISNEEFFEPLKDVVSDLKLRGSYGTLGNQLTSNFYPSTEVMGSGQSSWLIDGARAQVLNAPTPLSADITWEKTNSVNLGLDIGLLRNRLVGSFDIYRRKTVDMLTPGPTLSAVFGASSPAQNTGDLLTKGFELSLTWQQSNKVGGKDLSWSIGGVLSDYTAEITSFNNPTLRLSDHYVGKQLGEIWGYITDGYFATDEEASKLNADKVSQSLVYRQIRSSAGEWNRLRAGDLKFKDLNGDSIINNGANTLTNPGDMRVIGNSLPRYSFGITGNASWNNFDVSFFLQGIGKQNWYPGNNADKFWGPYSRAYYSFTPNGFTDKIWSKTNTNAYFPLLRSYEALNDGGTMRQPTDKYMQDLAYIRLKNLSVGYSLPAGLLRKLGFSNCRVYVTGENLFTLTKLDTDYIDPEQAGAETNGRVYPFMKSYAFGLDLSF